MTSSPFSTTTIPIQSSTGGQVNVKAAVLPNGNVVPAHVFVDAARNMLDPAKDATVQAATSAILAASASLLSTN